MINKNSRDFRINRRLRNKELISKYKKIKVLKKDANEFRINKRLKKESLENRKKRTIKRRNQDYRENERMNLFFLEPFFCL